MNQPGNVLSDIQSREGTDNLGCLIGDRVEPARQFVFREITLNLSTTLKKGEEDEEGELAPGWCTG